MFILTFIYLKEHHFLILLFYLLMTNTPVNFYGLTLRLLLFNAAPLEPDERQCIDLDEELRRLVIGEQFYFVPYDMGQNLSNDEVTWYRDDSLTEPISTDQNQRVHYRGGALLFMDLRPEDSGNYTAM